MNNTPSNQTTSVNGRILIDQELIDLVYRANGYNAFNSTISSLLGGFNMLGGKVPIPKNEDHIGYTFFTKPDMYLSYDNISSIRMLAKFTNDDPKSMGCALKCCLSPTGLFTHGERGQYADPKRSDLVDDLSPFIHLLSNTVVQVSGWQDKTAPYYTSTAGIGGEQVAFVDGRPDILGVKTLTATFDNVKGDAVYDLLSGWVEYSLNVAQGSINPYPYYLASNRIDYQTRIISILMDPSKKYIQKIACAPVAFPVSDPCGGPFNISQESKFTTEGDKIVVQFVTSGMVYNDPIIVYEFNRLVGMYNPKMEAKNGTIGGDMIKVDGYLQDTGYLLKNLFNFRCYPYMSTKSGQLELEWYTPKNEYDTLVKKIQEMKKKLKESMDSKGSNSTSSGKEKVTPWAESLITKKDNTQR
jgi:hypothetical protein